MVTKLRDETEGEDEDEGGDGTLPDDSVAERDEAEDGSTTESEPSPPRRTTPESGRSPPRVRTTQRREDPPPRDRSRRRRRDPRCTLDYSPSSGAVDQAHAGQDAYEDVHTSRHGYTENATFTNERLDAASEKFDTLNEINRQTWDGDGDIKQAQRDHDLRNDVLAWGQQIGLTDHERQRAAAVVEEVDNGYRNSMTQKVVVLAALTLAANEGDEHEAKVIREDCGIDTNNPDLVTAYEQLRERLNVEKTDVRSARRRLRRHL